jgi:hypothetical protein
MELRLLAAENHVIAVGGGSENLELDQAAAWWGVAQGPPGAGEWVAASLDGRGRETAE